MADDERDGPSLELPSFGLRRRKGRRGVSDEPTDVTAPDAEPTAAPEPTLGREPEPPVYPDPAPAPAVDPVAAPPPVVPAAERPHPLFADEAGPVAETVESQTIVADRDPDVGGPAEGDRKAEKAPREPRESGGMPFAMLTGLLIGLLTVGLTWVSLRGCEVAKGTSSCGGPGLLILVAIMILMILAGTALLRLFRLPDPGSTSFLAVGLIAVLALLFLVDLLFNWWMVIVIPLIGVATFALSHWVTTAFVEPARD